MTAKVTYERQRNTKKTMIKEHINIVLETIGQMVLLYNYKPNWYKGSRKYEIIFAKRIAAKYLYKDLEYTMKQVGEILHVDHSTVINLLSKYDDDNIYLHIKVFKDMVEKYITELIEKYNDRLEDE